MTLLRRREQPALLIILYKISVVYNKLQRGSNGRLVITLI